MLLTSFLNALPGAVTQGLIWGLMAIGVYITYRILDVADLTVDGSLALGGAACVMLIRGGVNPWLALLIGALYWFFGTEIGCGIRATGANARMARAQVINKQRNVVVGLALSNGIVALSGTLLSQYQGSADVNMGRGAIVIGLAAVIIGESLLGRVFHNFGLRLLAVSFGAIVYYLVLQVVLQLGLNTNDLKLLSAAIVAVFLAVPHLKGKITHKGGNVHA